MNNLVESFINLPDPLVDALTLLVVSGVVLGVNWLVVKVPWFERLRNYAEQWGYLAAAALIAWIQNAVPDIYEAVVVHGLYLILALLALVKMARTWLTRRGVVGFAE